MKKLKQHLLRYPPAVCRLLARTGTSPRSTRALEEQEIADLSGLSVPKVRSLSCLFSWDDVSVSDLFAFSEACGVDFSDSKNLMRQNRYVRSEKRFHYLRKHPDYVKVYQPLLTQLGQYLNASTGR